ncbi:MAG: hypothetical protein J8272_01930, partial ['Prunus persica' phytoplasma PP2]|nr:hypothetical protein ['Prunus persica' phytoplasma PP2]
FLPPTSPPLQCTKLMQNGQRHLDWLLGFITMSNNVDWFFFFFFFFFFKFFFLKIKNNLKKY